MGTSEGTLLGGMFIEFIHGRDRQRIEKLLLKINGGSERVDGAASEIMNRGCNGFIQKPFKIGELSQKLREILDEQ